MQDISAIAALAGSAVGGLTSLAASWLAQDVQARSQRIVADKTRRQDLYKSFVEEAARIYGDALGSNSAETSKLVGLYAMVSRMRILSSPRVVESADEVIAMIVDTYLSPNKTLRELNHLVDVDKMDPLRHFGEACREDLRLGRSF